MMLFFHLCPFIDMLNKNYSAVYKVGESLSINKACCAYKGKICFHQYNKNKPAKYHIKMYQISEASSGYVTGFHVFTNNMGINHVLLLEYKCMKKTSTITMSMMKRFFLLDKGHCLFMDNYYTSLELFQELEKKKMLACGTVQLNRKCSPQALRSTGN